MKKKKRKNKKNVFLEIRYIIMIIFLLLFILGIALIVEYNIEQKKKEETKTTNVVKESYAFLLNNDVKRRTKETGNPIAEIPCGSSFQRHMLRYNGAYLRPAPKLPEAWLAGLAAVRLGVAWLLEPLLRPPLPIALWSAP